VVRQNNQKSEVLSLLPLGLATKNEPQEVKNATFQIESGTGARNRFKDSIKFSMRFPEWVSFPRTSGFLLIKRNPPDVLRCCDIFTTATTGSFGSKFKFDDFAKPCL